MVLENSNEVVVEQVVYSFASEGIFTGFSSDNGAAAVGTWRR